MTFVEFCKTKALPLTKSETEKVIAFLSCFVVNYRGREIHLTVLSRTVRTSLSFSWRLFVDGGDGKVFRYPWVSSSSEFFGYDECCRISCKLMEMKEIVFELPERLVQLPIPEWVMNDNPPEWEFVSVAKERGSSFLVQFNEL
jgi:hypothetical protein